MTINDLTFDRADVAPDADGLTLPVSVTATAEPLGELRCFKVLQSRKGPYVLRWKAHNGAGTAVSANQLTREEAATYLLPADQQEAARTELTRRDKN